MVKLSIIEKYAELPKFYQRNVNFNVQSTINMSVGRSLTDGNSNNYQIDNEGNVCQEKENQHRSLGNGTDKIGKLYYRAQSTRQDLVTESIENFAYYPQTEETMVKHPVEALMSLCEYAQKHIQPLKYDKILDISNYKELNDVDSNSERKKSLHSDNAGEMDVTSTTSQEKTFIPTVGYVSGQGKSSTMQSYEGAPSNTPHGSLATEIDYSSKSNDLCNLDHAKTNDISDKTVNSCDIEDESDEEYTGHWKISMKNEVKMVISKAKRKTKSPKQNSGNEVKRSGQKKKIKLKLHLS